MGKQQFSLSISKSLFWVLLYFIIMLIYTTIDVVIWRKFIPTLSNWLNIGTMAVIISLFFYFLKEKNNFKIQPFLNINAFNILLAVLCSIGFYFLLDCFLDPIFEEIFPTSEADYQTTILNLKLSPITSFLQVCLIAPITEEILMRKFILGGLKQHYNVTVALLISSILFAILHFNMVQTLSALVCGIILGLLYIKTNSLLCCIIAHAGYNIISFLVILLF